MADDPKIVARPVAGDTPDWYAARDDSGEDVHLSDAPPPGGDRPSRGRLLIESVGLFAMGVLLMAYFFGPAPGGGEPAGLPGHDSFYHVKMAELLPRIGLVDKFPWLRFVYFTSDNSFVSHHWGFHLLLTPFVYAAKWITGDYLVGGRWFVCAGMGASFALLNLLLAVGGVRWRWIFWALALVLPYQFFLRHCYVRAINPSLVMMLLLILSLFWNRAILAGIVLALYVQVYLGALMYGPLIVIALVASRLWCAEITWRQAGRIAAYTFGGWLLGLLLHPYSSGVIEFLWLQVFGSGLSPDIEVGREWKPYNGVWWFALFSGPVWAFWLPALVLRLRYGPRLDGKALTLLLLKLAFLVLTLKARRFIEYWPMLALLSAAFLIAPVLDRLALWRRFGGVRDEPVATESAVVLYLLTGLALLVAWWCRKWFPDYWVTDWRTIALISIGIVIADWPRRPFSVGRWARLLAPVVLVFAGLATTAGPALAETRRLTKCQYPLVQIKQMMAEIQAQSEPGDLIFTDDWDLFPVFFCFNDHNHYAVGLDPKFTQHRRPDLWERYVRVTRGQVPRTVTVKMADDHGKTIDQKITIRLDDIHDYFQARFVICDNEHQSLADKLASDTDLAIRIYASELDGTHTRYTVFRILR